MPGQAADPGAPVGRPPWWSRRTLRARITLLATLVVALAVAGSALLAVQLLGYVLRRTIDDGARTQAAEVAALVRRDELPDPLPALGSTAGVQVVDGQGRVLAASAGGDRLVSLVPADRLAAVRAGAVVDLPRARLAGAESLRVVGDPADVGGVTRTVLVAVSVSDVSQSVHLVGVAVAVGSPVAIAAFALACWLLTGSALRPVEALRRGADEISDAGSARRLALPVARDEIRLLAETLNAMLHRLTVAAVAQRTFVADAAHELRSPLASLRVQLEVERDHPDFHAWPATADDLLADVARLDRLVADLLTLARAEHADRPRRPGPVDLHELAVAVAAELLPAAAGVRIEVAGVPLEVAGTGPAAAGSGAAAPGSGAGAAESGAGAGAGAAGAGAAVAWGDAEALRRVVTNLVANAVTHARRRVVLTTRSIPGGAGASRVLLEVADDGPGIAVADRERVFDRFTRLDTSRSADAGGSGLGLSIVARLVSAQGGTVSLSDTVPGSPARGLTATVELPGAPGLAAGRPGRAPVT